MKFSHALDAFEELAELALDDGGTGLANAASKQGDSKSSKSIGLSFGDKLDEQSSTSNFSIVECSLSAGWGLFNRVLFM